MAASAWTVAIRLMASSNMGLVTSNISKQAAGAEKSITSMNGSLQKTSKAADIANKALIGIGITAAVTFAIGIKGASDLQNATLQSAIAMGRMGNTLDQTMSKMRDFGQVAFNMSKITGQSLADSMGVVSSMASSGLNARQIKSASIPIAQYGDIMKYGVAANKSMSYADSAQLGAGLVHDLRLGLSGNDKTDAANTAYGLARIAQLSYLSPHGPNAVGTQIRRMAPTLETFLPGTVQSKATQITEMAAWVDRMGMLPFAGSAIGQMATQFLQPRSKRVGDSLYDLGIYNQHGTSKGMTYIPAPLTASPFFDKKSQTFDIIGALQQVGRATAAGKKSGDLTAFSALFGGPQNMQRILIGLSTPEAAQAKKNIDAQVKAMGPDPVAWMGQVQAQVMMTLSGQVGILITNFQTMATLLTTGLIPPLTTIANFLGSTIGRIDQSLIDHPDVAKAGGIALLVAGVAGVVALLKAGGNFIHFFSTLGKDPHIGAGIGHALGHGGGGRIAAAGVEVAEATTVVGLLSKGFIKPIIGFVGKFGKALLGPVGDLLLLETALELLIGSFAWLNNALGIHKQPNTPLSPAEQAAAAAAFHGNANVSTGRAGGTGASSLTPAERAAAKSAFQGVGSAGGHGRGKGVGGGQNVTVSFVYQAPSGGDDASHRRAFITGARKAAEQVAQVMSDVARTSGRAAGALPAMSGASHYEFAGSVG